MAKFLGKSTGDSGKGKKALHPTNTNKGARIPGGMRGSTGMKVPSVKKGSTFKAR